MATPLVKLLRYDLSLKYEEQMAILKHPTGYFDQCMGMANATSYQDLIAVGFDESFTEARRTKVLAAIKPHRERLRKMAWFSRLAKPFQEHQLDWAFVDSMLSALELEVAATFNAWILVHGLFKDVDTDVLFSLMHAVERVTKKPSLVGKQYAMVYKLMREQAVSREGEKYASKELVEEHFMPLGMLFDEDCLDWDVSGGHVSRHPMYDEGMMVDDYFTESPYTASERYCEKTSLPNLPYPERRSFFNLLPQITRWTDPMDETTPTLYRLRELACADSAIVASLFA